MDGVGGNDCMRVYGMVEGAGSDVREVVGVC